MIKSYWEALVLAWRGMAKAAGFRSQDLKAAACLTVTLLVAYVVALLLALTGSATSDPINFASHPGEPISVVELDHFYRPAESPASPIAPIFLSRFPGDYGEIDDASEYKRRFVQIVLPLVLAENRRVWRRRASILGILARDRSGIVLRPSQQGFLSDIGVLYGASGDEPDVLLRRVDAVPPSLALAQAAVESFWGRSRFAREGNALFGQWTYDASIGLLPRERPEEADYLVRKFAGLRASVRAYMINLNTHSAYVDFRLRRAEMRAGGQKLDGYDLAPLLQDYSQRGEAYTASLRSIIRVNRFRRYDSARLHP